MGRNIGREQVIIWLVLLHLRPLLSFPDYTTRSSFLSRSSKVSRLSEPRQLHQYCSERTGEFVNEGSPVSSVKLYYSVLFKLIVPPQNTPLSPPPITTLSPLPPDKLRGACDMYTEFLSVYFFREIRSHTPHKRTTTTHTHTHTQNERRRF